MYTWKLSDKFEMEFNNLRTEDQDKIIDFTDIFEVSGLTDFSSYEGKITPSWSGNISQEDFTFTKENHLWHYHVGIPYYEQVHSTYKTSDWLLHFQWPDKGNAIALVDLYRHYKLDGSFYLPPELNLDK